MVKVLWHVKTRDGRRIKKWQTYETSEDAYGLASTLLRAGHWVFVENEVLETK